MAMARQDKVNLPSGMGGLTRYFDDYTSNIELKPGHVIIMAIIVMVIIIFLHIQGGSLLTLG
jgi:preprotein translocase subunit Sec61beta